MAGEVAPSTVKVENLIGNGEHLLIVDEDARQQIITRELLESLGCSVYTVESGEEAYYT